MSITTPSGLGHNAGNMAESLRDDLTEKHEGIRSRAAELIAASERVPASIDNDETAGKIGDFIKQITACHKAAEGARVAEKEPHLAASRVVDGFFKAVTDPLEKAKKEIERRLTSYLREKADAERKARDEAARIEREAAEAARKAAEEAERQAKDSATLQTAIDAEVAAKQASADAERARKAAEANAAELSRNRGDYGSVSSLRTFWDFSDIDRATIDLETLRHHLPTDAMEKAVRSFIKAGGRDLRGVRIFENTQAAVR
jgi:chemotaxis protein histidine kinase CheA